MKKKFDPEEGPLSSENFSVESIPSNESLFSKMGSGDQYAGLIDLVEDIQSQIFDLSEKDIGKVVSKLVQIRDMMSFID